MNNKNPLYIVFGIVIGICISLTLTCSYAKMTRFKPQDKHIERVTLKQITQRVIKLENDVKQLKKGK